MVLYEGFPCGSAGKESACNTGDLGSIPGLGRSLKKGKATHSSILAWRMPWTIQSIYFGHLMRRTDSMEKTLMLGEIEGRRRG